MLRHRYYNHSVPRLVHKLGFSLARADVDAEAFWLRKPLPAIRKPAAWHGVVMFADETRFWLGRTLHQTPSRVGVPPRLDMFGERKASPYAAPQRLFRDRQRAPSSVERPPRGSRATVTASSCSGSRRTPPNSEG